MRRSRALIVLLATLALAFTGLSSASAAPKAPPPSGAPEILFVAPVAWTTPRHSDTVKVVGTYRCFGGESIHLWVSVKQGGPDPTVEGSSSTVDAWYDTNVSQDVAVRCDGRWHTKKVELGRNTEDSTGRPLGYLHDGKAWLQFCLVAGETEGLLDSEMLWVPVIGTGRR